MAQGSFTRGIICLAEEGVDLDKSVVVAEVYSKSLRPEDEGFVACYFLAHGLEPADAEKAMNFFAAQPGLLVDADRLVDDAGAEFPALVTIRYTDDTSDLLSTLHEFGILRELPDDEVILRQGWDLFWALDAISRGDEVPLADPLPPFDYRALRRKVFALRNGVQEDRSPWLTEEYKRLRRLTEGSPEGCERFVALADDMEAALSGNVDIDEAYSVVIPTTVERMKAVGAISDWVPQAGREIVVAHGLDAYQAARVLHLVKEEPETFVAMGQLLHGRDGRERLNTPIVVPDKGLNWISSDFSGRRSQAGYDILRQRLNEFGQGHDVQSPQRSAGR